jgi:opacity protein-like surface antigen
VTASTLALLIALPAMAGQSGYRASGHWGEDQVFRFDLGAFTPRGDSRYWDDKEVDFTGDADDFEDAVLGVEWVKFLGDRTGLALGATFWEGGTDQAYLDFVDDRGFDIVHRTDLEVSSLTLGLLFHLTQRDRAIVPYVGAGGGVWAWRLTEVGEFIDFTQGLEIFDDFFEDDGTALGYYWRAGLEVPIADSWAVHAEARWQRVDDDLGADFEGLGELDLSGRSISAGLSVSF